MYVQLPQAYYGFGITTGEDVYAKCGDDEFVRGRLDAHGMPAAPKTGNAIEDQASVQIAMHEFGRAKGIIPAKSNIGDYTPQEYFDLCKALLAEPAAIDDGGDPSKEPPPTSKAAIDPKYGYMLGGAILGILILGAIFD